ncbi:MAG: protein-glutamate O-methyltransferase CheR [Desulfobulbaceae bacterium]|nr:protein-glutamate O-methyltransferase CheR [Desulfobulbaceae bacterium]
MTDQDIEDIEIRLLVEGIFQVYGYDFREYGEASLKRRLTQWLQKSGCANFSAVQAVVLHDRAAFSSLLEGITVNVSEMFRDPQFFKDLREKVVPHLKTYPFSKIWVAGCAAGEEAYSLAIVLSEEGLAGRYRIYATDINETVLHQAGAGIYPLEKMRQFTQNYQKAGGKRDFADYYTARYDRALLAEELKKDIIFAVHNLTVDAGLGEMQLLLCRNLLIYFKAPLKERVLGLFDDSLSNGGFLCLGLKETLSGRGISARYQEVAPGTRIYRKQYV